MKKKLTKDELKKLSKLLSEIEGDILNSYSRISGGFAEAKMFDYDDYAIDIELKFGIEGDSVYTEQLEIDRETMKIID